MGHSFQNMIIHLFAGSYVSSCDMFWSGYAPLKDAKLQNFHAQTKYVKLMLTNIIVCHLQWCCSCLNDKTLSISAAETLAYSYRLLLLKGR